MKAFISYAHEDRRHATALRRQLHPIAELRSWIDMEIGAGDRWEDAILRELDSADIILLCISADSIWSSYIDRVELKRAREREGRGECAVIPVILRDCLWDWKENLRDLQGVPRDGKPIQFWNPRDAGYADAARSIGRKVKELAGRAAP